MKKVAVLIVDDSREDRYLFVRDLQQTGFDLEVVEVPGAEEGLAFLSDFEANKQAHGENFPPALVFLDVNMPKINGYQFLEAFSKLREQFQLKTCVVMMLSTSGRESDREKAMAYDFVKGYLIKGKCSKETLRGIIKSVI